MDRETAYRGERLSPPQFVRIPTQVGIIVTAVARHLRPDECGFLECFILAVQLHLGHYQALVVAIEFIYLENMVAATHQIACLVDDARLAQLHQVLGIAEGYLRLELIAGQACLVGRPLYGQITAVVADTHTHRLAVPGAYIALPDAAVAICLVAKFTRDQELPFDLQSHRQAIMPTSSRTLSTMSTSRPMAT